MLQQEPELLFLSKGLPSMAAGSFRGPLFEAFALTAREHGKLNALAEYVKKIF